MQELPLALRRYLWLVNIACVVVVITQTVPGAMNGDLGRVSASSMQAAGVFALLALAGHYTVLQISRTVSQDLATPTHVAAILLLPPPLPLLLTLLSSAASETMRRHSPLQKRVFNVSHPTLTVGLSSAICSLVVKPTQILHPNGLAAGIPAVLLLGVSFYLVDVAVMVGIPALLQTRSPLIVWWEAYRPALLPELAGSSIGIVGAILWLFDPLALVLAALPVIALRVAFVAIAQAEERSQALRRRSEQLEAVLKAGQQLRVQHTQADLLQPLAEAARTIVGATAATGYLRDEENPELLKRVVLVPDDGTGAGPSSLRIPEQSANLHEMHVEGSGHVVPLLLEPDGTGVVGLLLLSGESLAMGQNERDTLIILADQAAIALQNARLHERALAQASEDGLTGLLNHRAFQTRLEEEVARAQRGAHSLALLMIDMDDFGTVNNTYGHQVGDATLSAVAKALRQTIRAEDVAARYGGDEFVVILPETQIEDASALAKRVCSAIESLLVIENGLTICVHASIGVAGLPLHARTREDLIRAADQAAYAAKHAGKDRVCRPEDASFSLERDPAALATQLEHANLATVAALAAAVDAKDPYTRGHSQRVSAYATALAGAMGLPHDQISRIELAGLLHDVGKIGVPDAILSKPAKLSPEEYQIIMQHSEIGARMLAAVPFLHEILPAVRHHHERWDGKGYPDGLREDGIPLDAAVLMVADSLDAMTSTRTYRPALPLGEARRRILEGRGTQFHPRVVKAFEQALEDGSLILLSSQPHHPSFAGPAGRLSVDGEHNGSPPSAKRGRRAELSA